MKPEPLTRQRFLDHTTLITARIEQVMEEHPNEFHQLLLRRALVRFDKFVDDVKSAVQWLLEELEKEQKSAMRDLKEIKYRKNPLQHKWLDGYIDGLVHAEVKIKKAFSGVVE